MAVADNSTADAVVLHRAATPFDVDLEVVRARAAMVPGPLPTALNGVKVAGEPHRIGPEMAAYVPANTMHKIDVDDDKDLAYVVIYAPPGPEKLLRSRQEGAFDA